MTTTYRIATIPGDGIGLETTPAAVRCLDAVAARYDLRLAWEDLDWGSDHYRRRGRMMPTDGLERIVGADAVFLGAVGDPEIPDAETLWGLLVPIRRAFDQYVNLRPARSLPGIRPVLASGAEVDLLIVRENTEGEYSRVGGRSGTGEHEQASQVAVFTRRGVARVTRYASELARGRRGLLTSATKSNGIIHTMPFWDEVVAETTSAGPDAPELRSVLVDALAAALVLHPERFDVIVASNLLGDILSDLASAVTGSIGVAPSANLNPERRHPSMFEPVHGTAPDIAGQGVANPVGQIWSGAMMLDHLGETAAAAHLVRAFERVLASGTRTGDLGGDATTDSFTDAVVASVETSAEEHG